MRRSAKNALNQLILLFVEFIPVGKTGSSLTAQAVGLGDPVTGAQVQRPTEPFEPRTARGKMSDRQER